MFKEKQAAPLKFLWHLLIIIMIVFSAVEAPILVTFNGPIDDFDVWKDLLISSIFFIDFIVSFILKFKKVKKVPYKDIYLWIDLAASIPFDVISRIFSLPSATGALRLIRLLRLLKFRQKFSLGKITILPLPLKVSFILITSLIVVNLITCGWLYIYPNVDNIPVTSFYLRGLYWSMTTLTTIGYGDITPSTDLGMIYTILVMIIGLGVYGIVIGSFARLFALADRHKEQNREKLNDLQVFMKHYSVPSNVQKSTFSYYNHLLSKRISTNDQNIIAELPVVLQEELKTYMNIRMIKNIPAFQGSSHACLKQIAQSLKQTAYAPGQKIIKKGDIGKEMYVIGHGEVDILIEDKSVTTLNDGQFFGEVALIKEVVRTADVVAKSYCDLYTLKKDDFLRVIKCYPNLLKKIEKSTS